MKSKEVTYLVDTGSSRSFVSKHTVEDEKYHVKDI